MSGCLQIIWVVSKPPWIKLKTPFGKLIYYKSLTKCIAAPGTLSDGFKTKVLPQVIAIGNIQRGIIAGKLNAETPAQTPRGVLKE